MTNNQLTKEWLQQTIAELESVSDEIPFGIDTNSELELAAFKMALAAMHSEPVAYAWVSRSGKKHLTRCEPEQWRDAVIVTPLYRHAQPAPVVQCPYPCGWDNLNKLAIQDAALVARGLVEGEPATEAQRQAAISNNDRLLKVISVCRAAMLQPPHTIKAASALGSLPKTGEVLHTNSPVIPDGWKLVPIDATRSMIDAARRVEEDGYDAMHKAMLAAAPQLTGSDPATVPGKWIPVSERMPDAEGCYLVWVNASKLECYCDHLDIAAYQGGEWGNEFGWLVTHWMPLPATPQEVKP